MLGFPFSVRQVSSERHSSTGFAVGTQPFGFLVLEQIWGVFVDQPSSSAHHFPLYHYSENFAEHLAPLNFGHYAFDVCVD
jgi:hypothetical protein